MRSHVTVDGEALRVSDAIRDRVRFEVANLVQPGRGGERFDVILCRNALLYFTPEGKKRAAATFLAALHEDGTLWIGAAESLRSLVHDLKMDIRGHRVCYVRRPVDEVAPTPPPALDRVSVWPRGRDTQLQGIEPPRSRAWGLDASRMPSLLDDATPPPASVPLDHDMLDPRAALREAITHRQADRWDAASDSLRRALFLAPDFWPASWLLAATAGRLGDTPTQVRELERTLRLLQDPGASETYADLLDDLLPDDVRAACRRGLLQHKPPHQAARSSW